MKIQPLKEYSVNYPSVQKKKAKGLKKAAVLLSASLLAAGTTGCVATSGIIENDLPTETPYQVKDGGEDELLLMGEEAIETPEPIIEPDLPVVLDGDVMIEDPTPEPDPERNVGLEDYIEPKPGEESDSFALSGYVDIFDFDLSEEP